jgi:hypothetical protein
VANGSGAVRISSAVYVLLDQQDLMIGDDRPIPSKWKDSVTSSKAHARCVAPDLVRSASRLGKQVQFMVLSIDQVVDGKIVKHWALPDWMGIIYQLGATIQPATPVS